MVLTEFVIMNLNCGYNSITSSSFKLSFSLLLAILHQILFLFSCFDEFRLCMHIWKVDIKFFPMHTDLLHFSSAPIL